MLRAEIDGGSLTVSLNGTEVLSTVYTPIGGTRVGGRVSIGEEADESFPNTPVDVRLRVTQPVAIP